MRLAVPDPFSGRTFYVDPVEVMKKCVKAYKKTGNDHANCKHCPKLKDLVIREVDREAFYAAVRQPMPCSPDDTQPPVETGFVVVH